MYYLLLERPASSDEPVALIETCPQVPGVRSWCVGKKISAPVELPLRFDLDQNYPGRFPDFFDTTIPLFRKSLVAAMRDGGVTDLDTYDAVLLDRDDAVVSDEYVAVNVLSVPTHQEVEAADQRGRPYLLFRLAGSYIDVYLHDTLKQHLVSRGFGQLGYLAVGTDLTRR